MMTSLWATGIYKGTHYMPDFFRIKYYFYQKNNITINRLAERNQGFVPEIFT